MRIAAFIRLAVAASLNTFRRESIIQKKFFSSLETNTRVELKGESI